MKTSQRLCTSRNYYKLQTN